VQVASTCGEHHLAGSRPHAQGRAVPGLRPTVGTYERAPPPLTDRRMLTLYSRRSQPILSSEANRARICEQCSSLNSARGSAARRRSKGFTSP